MTATATAAARAGRARAAAAAVEIRSRHEGGGDGRRRSVTGAPRDSYPPGKRRRHLRGEAPSREGSFLPGGPFGLDLEGDAPIGGPVVVATTAPPERGAQVAAEGAGEPQLPPLPHVDGFVPPP